MKKYFAIAFLILAIFSAPISKVDALTLNDLLTQINSLQEQITNLKSQIVANAGTGLNNSGNEWVTTDASTNISYNSTNVNGRFGAYYLDNVSVNFRYGTEPSLLNSQITPIVSLSGPSGSLNQSIVGLNYNTNYYYRIEVTSPNNSGYASLNGEINNFKTKAREGICGTSNNQSFVNPPVENLCSGGAPTGVTGLTQWNWSCLGVMGSTVKSNCAAKRIVDIGPANVPPGQPQPVVYYTVPTGITKISSVEIWGPGGGGGGSTFCSNNFCTGNGGGGGQGGEYKKLSNLIVTPGEIFTMKIFKGGLGGIATDNTTNSSGFGFRSEDTSVKIKNVTTISKVGYGGKPGNLGIYPAYASNLPDAGYGLVGYACVGGNGGKGGGNYGALGGIGGLNLNVGLNDGKNGNDGYSGSGGGGGGGNGGGSGCSTTTGLHGNGGKGGDGRVLITYPFIPVINNKTNNS